MAHGIEIWGDLSGIQKRVLNNADRIIAVSNFTKAEVAKKHNIPSDKIVVCNNGLDPFMIVPANFDKPQELLTRYKLHKDDYVLFTLTRLSSVEQYKGYDKVIEALAEITGKKPNIKYLIGGKGDENEVNRIKKQIKTLDLQNNVDLIGFIKEEEMESHFLLANTYIMPSQNEGFGIVFIEAGFYGLPIIAGNNDGSKEAIIEDEINILIFSQDKFEIVDSIKKNFLNIKSEKSSVHKLYFKKFHFQEYKNNLLSHLNF
jgi:glycosyltransferase involved in cell wall biosynthesis